MENYKEKAKAYDEASKRVAVRFGTDVADEIFLKESEGERIRKEIISYIKSSGAVTNKQWIAWLEKQGKQNINNSEL